MGHEDHFFYEGPESKYFQFGATWSLLQLLNSPLVALKQ